MSGRARSPLFAGMRIRYRASGGFTLLEITVAFAVVAIAALGVLSCLTTGYNVDREATDSIAAMNLARRVIEELWNSPFDTLISSYDNTQIVQENLRASIRVQRVAPATGAASLLRLQTTVRQVGGTQDLIALVTLRSDHRAPRSAWLTGN